MPGRSYADLKLYARLVGEARPYWLHIITVFLVSLLATPIALLMPLPLKIAVDSVIGLNPMPGFVSAIVPGPAVASQPATFLLAAALLVLIALLDQFQRLGTYVLSTYTVEKLILHFRARLFRHVQRLSLSYHDARGTADSLYRIEYDVMSSQWIAIYGLTPIVTGSLTPIGMVYVMGRLDGQLALVALAVAPIIFLITWWSRSPLQTAWLTTKRLESMAFSVVQEVLGSLRVVKAFGQEDREEDRFVARAREGIQSKVRTTFVERLVIFLVALTTALGSALVLFVGMTHVHAGLLSVGDLVLVMGYLTQLYLPMQVMSTGVATLQSSVASAERVFALLDEAPEVPERPDVRPLARAAGAVTFRGVSFAYDGRDPVLHGISFEIAPGTHLGISGATGAGKTTLVSLLMRFYDPSDGQILLDGVDLRDYKLVDLRNQFAIVLQEPVLFSTSVAENIAYARPDASEHEIIEAAKAANAHEFIMALPNGYDTLVGERGMTLSGGERQRISLARAFLKDTPILILDEPTSSVDIKTEAVIMEAMERLMRGRTTFMIAHRASTLSKCDMLLEIDYGRVSGVTPIQPSGYV